jgi:[ribosomal protein S18]-alanine N-acetyltransferase
VLSIRALGSEQDAHLCAKLMSTSEPWVTLRRGYEESRKLVEDPSREVYVAYEGDQFRGFIIVLMQGAFVGYIQIVAVTPEARGTGVGTELIRFAEERIFAIYPNVFLCVSSFNPRARALYERLGYELIGEIRDFLVIGYSEFLLRKTIGPIRPQAPGPGPQEARTQPVLLRPGA